MEPYFLGTQPDGGYWLILERLDAHDHTGGLLGKPLTAATIPDGSITTSKLDPSVLAPYAMTDGSKPFTGQVTMQADAVVRDALFFGQQGTALAPDVTLTRTGAGALSSNASFTLAPGAGALALILNTATASGVAALQSVQRAGANKWHLGLDAADAFTLYTGDYSKTPVKVAPTGTLTLTPDAGQAALVVGERIAAASGHLQVVAASGFGLIPATDNFNSSGGAANRWTAVYAVSGTINTSLAEAKEAITPLDPATALAAVLNTDPVVFDYKPPERDAAYYELPDDPEQAETVLYQRLTSSPLEAAARHQAGFVLQDATGQYQTDPLFETGEGQSNAANSVGVLLAAIHALSSRLDALEGAN